MSRAWVYARGWAPPNSKCAGSPRTAFSTIAFIGPTNWFMPSPYTAEGRIVRKSSPSAWL